MTVKEYAEQNDVSVQSVYQRIKRGTLVLNGDPVESPLNSVESVVVLNGDDWHGFKFPIADSRFTDIGRMRPVNGMVKVFWGPGQDDRMVPEDEWLKQMTMRCVEHKRPGWSCTSCMNDPLSIWERNTHIR